MLRRPVWLTLYLIDMHYGQIHYCRLMGVSSTPLREAVQIEMWHSYMHIFDVICKRTLLWWACTRSDLRHFSSFQSPRRTLQRTFSDESLCSGRREASFANSENPTTPNDVLFTCTLPTRKHAVSNVHVQSKKGEFKQSGQKLLCCVEYKLPSFILRRYKELNSENNPIMIVMYTLFVANISSTTFQYVLVSWGGYLTHCSCSRLSASVCLGAVSHWSQRQSAPPEEAGPRADASPWHSLRPRVVQPG